MIERHFDIPFVAGLALREKQIQQNYRPIIAVHKWFARRPGTLFRALLLSEFVDEPAWQSYYREHSLANVRIFDPFMGGGTTMVEANRVGCSVTGYDINPMAWWVVRQELGSLDVDEYVREATRLRASLEREIGELYRTRCVRCGDDQAQVKYFLWVKSQPCAACDQPVDLFPSYLLAEDVRHFTNVFVCGHCGELYDSADRKKPGPCPHCGHAHTPQFTARRNRVNCRHCGSENRYCDGKLPGHRMFALEYHCGQCSGTGGRLFKRPDAVDLAKTKTAERRLRATSAQFVPEDAIPHGDETERLHRWGYAHYREMFNARQLLGLEHSCRYIAGIADKSIREALATNLSDLLRYQNMLCRYDTMALKSLDVFSVHGFPVGLVQCESNLLGIAHPSRGTPVGSGGWLNMVEKFAKAKRYCDAPFEIRQERGKKVEVKLPAEWIGERRNGTRPLETREVNLRCGDASEAKLKAGEFDAVFTDPPYFGNVQYAELMDFCFVWLRKLAGLPHSEFDGLSTRHANELTGNVSMGRDLSHFTEGLATTFRKAAVALKAGRPLAFTYHHNHLEAYLPIIVAILDAGLVCSGSLPCPAEMGASIHINGTGSSIVDTVFVCRSTGRIPRRWLAGTAADVAALVREDLRQLMEGTVKPTQGDIRCIAFGHLARMAVWTLRHAWQRTDSVSAKLSRVRQWLEEFGGVASVIASLGDDFADASTRQAWTVREAPDHHDEVSF
jgi:adenine-specific DNA methylase